MEQIKKNLYTGITRLKWVARFLAERIQTQTSAGRLLYEASKLKGRMDELYSEMGRKIMELREKDESSEQDVFKDAAVLQTMDEIKQVKQKIVEIKEQAGKINKFSEE
ncbi:MAG: hypothetical protein ISR96_06480 [Nitrospira sp.]|nr:hypothetical protein [Nitrospira sp.]